MLMKRSVRAVLVAFAVCAIWGAATTAASDIGRTRVVHDGAGDALRITIIKAKPFHAYGSFSPDPGMKWFGAYIRLRNIATHGAQFCLDQWLSLRHSVEAIAESNAQPELNCPTLQPGQQATGWIVWMLRKRINPTFFDWVASSPTVHEKVSWKLG
jgi:hypothetical protein